MKKGPAFLVLLCLSLTLVPSLFAQQASPTPPPRVLQIFREEVKPGKTAAHEKVEVGWPRAFAKANWPTHYTAMVSITGPNEAWYATGYESFETWEKDQKNIEGNAALQSELDQLSGQDGELLSNTRSIVATYREDLSHRPGFSLPLTRYFSVTIVRVRPGHNPDFEEARKIVKGAHEKAGLKDNHSVWQVVSGMPNGTFLIITPMRSLAEMDAAPQVHGTEYQNAIGDDGRRKLRELASSGTISSDNTVFAVNPKMSYVAKETVAADPGFWNPKPATKVVPIAKKAGEKVPAKP